MAIAQKFLFDENFDAGPPPEMITASHAEVLQQIAHEKALESAKSMSHTLASEQLQIIVQKLEDVKSIEESHLSQIGEEAAALVTIVIQKLFPILAQKGALEEVKAAFESASRSFQDQKKITFSVHPDLVEDIKNYVIEKKSPVSIDVMGDPSLEISDCRLSWDQGGVERYLKWMIREIIKILMSSAEPKLIEALISEETSYE
ncbi:Flagellar assembly protein FliH [Candidatus Bealeia paramacronuclearis]|uniref:Flagellar assembly protein FliH n=1 Tax=Candidatus Bealeia paramacronuclearis TaxID=1921001 RepID=A0ABZ2C3V2_9PROT|nr:Flagellar assembly protein FliH [Candidatus Bealeia paramacronuclearis]